MITISPFIARLIKSAARFSGLAAVAALLLLAWSCGSSKSVTASAAHTSYNKQKSDRKSSPDKSLAPPPIPSSLTPSTKKLLQQAYGWLGTPYAYGGTDHKGIDCSGLVMNVYRDALDIKLPRSSSKQQEYCQPLDISAISEGDLLFFTPSGKDIGHVGLYVGSGYMIHASTTGVVITPLDSPWVKTRFHSAGRVATYWSAVAEETKKLHKESLKHSAPSVKKKTDGILSAKQKKNVKSAPAAPAIKSLASDSIAFSSFFE